MSNGFVCLVGMGTVFAGLICIIALCYIMSAVCKIFAKPEKQAPVKKAPVAKSQKKNNSVENKQEIVAGVCAAIAEDLGTDVENIKVTSFKKM